MSQPPLENEAFVLRGGLMELIPLRIALDTCLARYMFYGLSVFGDNGLTVAQIVNLSPLEHPRIRVSTVGRLRTLGLEPQRWGTYPHLTIRFEMSPTDEQLVELTSVFDQPIPNPKAAR